MDYFARLVNINTVNNNVKAFLMATKTVIQNVIDSSTANRSSIQCVTVSFEFSVSQYHSNSV